MLNSGSTATSRILCSRTTRKSQKQEESRTGEEDGASLDLGGWGTCRGPRKGVLALRGEREERRPRLEGMIISSLLEEP